jgi:site-specific DNA-cytosine methylase
MPLAIDLFCGLGGWAEGLLAEGFDVIGFDIERHVYGEHRYPGLLVIQDVTTLHGSQFKKADLIVASPPCQEYSYMAMPWKRAKAKATAIRADTTGEKLAQLTRLFNAARRIQFEASIAAGRHIPMVIENVKGAQPWVGRARWNFGSFYLWGDVPALMPPIAHVKVRGLNWSDYRKPGYKPKGFNMTAAQNYRRDHTGIKSGGDWFNASQPSISRLTSSKSDSRKAASAMIAKIPLPLSRHIAATYRPKLECRD